MNDDAYERLFTDGLTGLAPTRAPAGLGSTIKTTTSPMRPRPRWLALVKEPPMRVSSTVVVGSPTARMTVILATTLLVAVLVTGAVVAGATLLEGPGSDGPIIVAQDGSGDFTSIAEAVAAAVDGDIVRIREGTYQGGVVVDKDITIRGQGARDGIFVEVPADGPMIAGVPFAIHILDTTATIANLSIHGPSEAVGIAIEGGAPALEGLDIVLECCYSGQPRDAFRYFAGAAGTMDDVTIDGYARILSGSSPTIERLDHTKEGMWIEGLGTNPVIIDSELSPDIVGGAEPTITESRLLCVVITGADAVIQDSVFSSPAYMIGDDYDNSADDVAIDIASASPILRGNRIEDHPIGIRVNGGAPVIEGNTIEHNAVGMSVLAESGMTFSGNTFCGNESDLEVADGSAITLDGNEVCAG